MASAAFSCKLASQPADESHGPKKNPDSLQQHLRLDECIAHTAVYLKVARLFCSI